MLLLNYLLVLELNKVTSEKTLAEERKTNKLLELSHAELKKSSQNMECELKRKTRSISEAEKRVEEVDNEMERLKEEFRFDIYSTCAFISISLCLLLSLFLSNSVLTGSYLPKETIKMHTMFWSLGLLTFFKHLKKAKLLCVVLFCFFVNSISKNIDPVKSELQMYMC